MEWTGEHRHESISESKFDIYIGMSYAPTWDLWLLIGRSHFSCGIAKQFLSLWNKESTGMNLLPKAIFLDTHATQNHIVDIRPIARVSARPKATCRKELNCNELQDLATKLHRKQLELRVGHRHAVFLGQKRCGPKAVWVNKGAGQKQVLSIHPFFLRIQKTLDRYYKMSMKILGSLGGGVTEKHCFLCESVGRPHPRFPPSQVFSWIWRSSFGFGFRVCVGQGLGAKILRLGF